MKQVRVSSNSWAMVDDEDFDRVYEFSSWYIHKGRKTEYAHSSKDKYILMHRFIMGLEYRDGKQIDHIDGNGLNNQKSNLRIVTQTINNLNKQKQKYTTSKYKGVYWSKRGIS